MYDLGIVEVNLCSTPPCVHDDNIMTACNQLYDA